MTESKLDQAVLTGLIAVQAGIIDVDQLAPCFEEWNADREQSFEVLLRRKGGLADDQLEKLKRLVAEQRARSGADVFDGLDADEQLTMSLQQFIDDPAIIERLQKASTHTTNPQKSNARDEKGNSDRTYIGPYKLLTKLGEGGMGTVFLAEQETPVRRRVALKVIRKGMDTAQVLARFDAERQALALMDHNNIAKVLDTGETDDGRPYFAMELVKGIPVTDYCDQNRLNVNDRLNLFVDICRAVQHAHQKGIIHRDIKPSNVLVTLSDNRPTPKIIDFGLAKALKQNLTEHTVFTQLGQVLGTLQYMSPEQAEMNALDIDTRTDIYSLGVLLYELLTGSTPLKRQQVKEKALDEILSLIRESEPPKPGTRIKQSENEITTISECRNTNPSRLSQLVKGDLDWIVMKALEKDRTRRYESAGGFADDILRHLNDEPVMATPPSAGYRFRKFARRNKGLLAGGVTLALVLTAASIVSTVFAAWAKNERDEAQLSADKFEAINNFIIDDVLAAARPKGMGLGVDATLKDALDGAVGNIDSAFSDQPEIEAEIRLTLGQSYLELGASNDAETQLSKSLKLRKNLYGSEHSETLKALRLIGRLLFSQSRYDEATAHYQQLYKTSAKVYGTDHRHTLDAQRNLARAVSENGKPQDAKSILQETLHQSIVALGDDDSVTLSTRDSLANTLWDLGELVEAEKLFRLNWELRKERDGERYPETLVSMNNLASILEYQNKLDEAGKLYRESIQLRKDVFGPEHPKTISVMNNLAILHYHLKDYAEAERQMRKVVELQKKVRSPEHAYTLRSMMTLAAFLQKQRKSAEAESLTHEALEIQKRAMGEEHPDTLATMNNLAQILRGQKKFEDAVKVHREVLELRRKTKVRWQDIAISLSGVGGSLQEDGKFTEAEPLLRECAELYRQHLPASKSSFIGISARLARCLTKIEKFEDAEQLLLELHKIVDEKDVPASSKNTIVKDLIGLYETWEKTDEADEWRSRLIEK